MCQSQYRREEPPQRLSLSLNLREKAELLPFLFFQQITLYLNLEPAQIIQEVKVWLISKPIRNWLIYLGYYTSVDFLSYQCEVLTNFFLKQ